MRKIVTVTAAGLLLLMSSACSSKPAATEASLSPAPTSTVSTAAPSTASPSASIAPTPAPSASKEPSAAATPSPAATAKSTVAPTTAPAGNVTATPSPVSTAKSTTAPTVAPTIAATATPKPAATPAPSVTAPEGNAKAEALFKANCMSCHGANMEGGFGPNLTKIGSQLTKDKIVEQITNGGGDMPAQGKKVAAADIEILAAWLAGMK